MCRVVSTYSLGRKARLFVESYGGDGIVWEPEEEPMEEEEHVEYVLKELYESRTHNAVQGGMW